MLRLRLQQLPRKEMHIYADLSFPRRRKPSYSKGWIPAFAGMTNKFAPPQEIHFKESNAYFASGRDLNSNKAPRRKQRGINFALQAAGFRQPTPQGAENLLEEIKKCSVSELIFNERYNHD